MFNKLIAALQRDDHCLTPPTGARLGPARKAAGKLLEAGLVKEVRTRKDAPVWRRDDFAVAIDEGRNRQGSYAR
jgi:hypothetical protein